MHLLPDVVNLRKHIKKKVKHTGAAQTPWQYEQIIERLPAGEATSGC